MTIGGWSLRVALAIIGIVVGTFLAEALIGGALGWMVGGAVMGAAVWPLYRSLLDWRREKDERLRRDKGA